MEHPWGWSRAYMDSEEAATNRVKTVVVNALNLGLMMATCTSYVRPWFRTIRSMFALIRIGIFIYKNPKREVSIGSEDAKRNEHGTNE